MKLSLLLFLLSFSIIAKPQHFGKKVAKISKESLTPISKLLETPKNYEGKEVTISGMVTNVCSMRGCWMEFASDKKYQSLRIKVRDGDMVFPLSAKGKVAYATGTLHSKTYSKDELISFAKQRAKKSGKPADLSKITGPQTYHNFIPTGVSIE